VQRKRTEQKQSSQHVIPFLPSLGKLKMANSDQSRAIVHEQGAREKEEKMTKGGTEISGVVT
jgi:hypothetical protein